MFISIDGIDGCGKSIQVELLAQWLRARDAVVVTCRDPGNTDLGEAIRQIVLHSTDPICRRSEMLLYMAARAQLVEDVIRPALERGDIVVSDRYLLANVVYQGHAGGLEAQQLWDIGEYVVDGVQPELTFVLDLPLDVAAGRLSRAKDRMESRDREFHRRVRDGFLREAGQRAESFKVLDATRTIEDVQAEIRGHVEARMHGESA